MGIMEINGDVEQVVLHFQKTSQQMMDIYIQENFAAPDHDKEMIEFALYYYCIHSLDIVDGTIFFGVLEFQHLLDAFQIKFHIKSYDLKRVWHQVWSCLAHLMYLEGNFVLLREDYQPLKEFKEVYDGSLNEI